MNIMVAKSRKRSTRWAQSFCHFGFRRFRKSVIGIAGIFMVATIYIFAKQHNNTGSSKHPNYFLNFNKHKNDGYIVSTPMCTIINMPAWDWSFSKLLEPKDPPPDCAHMKKHWTYVNGGDLVVNYTAVTESGYPLNSVQCAYKVISRVEQSVNNYSNHADRRIRISSQWILLTNEHNQLNDEFVTVQCLYKYWHYFTQVVYTNHHALIHPRKTSVMTAKIKKWSTSLRLPPNVIMLGMDSVTRLNFRRTLNRTANFLSEIGAVEMLGYTKVGENTFPNAVAFLSGYNIEDLRRICYDNWKPQDGCPYVWKRFNGSGYLTAHLEDAPSLQIFHYAKLGFLKQQVDFYIRPWSLHVYNYPGSAPRPLCIGPDTVDSKYLRYFGKLLKTAENERTPLFMFTWLTDLSHDNMNAPQFVDELYESFLRGLNLDNTIMFFMSDHGFRFGAFRETDQGWYEDKLPNFWVYLPPELRRKRPEWFRNLQINSRRLSSPFNLYWTLEHILNEFTDDPPQEESRTRTGQTVPRKFGQSFFSEISVNMTCEEAGIPVEYCACHVPHQIPLDTEQLLLAALTAISYVNNQILTPQCSKLKLSKITAGAETTLEGMHGVSLYYIVTFIVSPGDFLLEAIVKYDLQVKTYTVSERILRMSAITRDADCVDDSQLQRFCYCL